MGGESSDLNSRYSRQTNKVMKTLNNLPVTRLKDPLISLHELCTYWVKEATGRPWKEEGPLEMSVTPLLPRAVSVTQTIHGKLIPEIAQRIHVVEKEEFLRHFPCPEDACLVTIERI